jgi:pimeloyl-ACP methyl ester carboxylesterase
MAERSIETRRGIKCRVREAGRGAPLVFLHGAGGLLPTEPLLDSLAARFHVFAPTWPGFGAEGGEDALEDMLDFTLHGWDVVEALGVERPHLVGHSMGGMIAAEMAALNNGGVEKLALIAPAGVWLDEHPIPDMFAMTPFELPRYLFADAKAGEGLLTAGLDLSNNDALKGFMIGNSRRLGTAGKLLFPIPNRRFSKRAYRVSAKTLICWGNQDRLIPPVYAEAWQRLIPQAEVARIEGAGHMVTLEKSAELAACLCEFIAG